MLDEKRRSKSVFYNEVLKMNGHVKPTQKPESNLEITEIPVQQLPDNELDAIAGGRTFCDILVSSWKNSPERYSVELENTLISS